MKTFYSKKEVHEMLKGEHSSQKKKVFTGIPDDASIKKINDINKVREVGEKWEEYNEDGTVKCIWEQKKGYRIKSSPAGSLMSEYQEWKNSYPNCFGADCATREKHRLDEKYRLIYGMCSECAAKYETKLKTSGSWQAFERSKMLENAKSFFKEADSAVEETVSRLKKVEFVNDAGNVEKWGGDPEMAESLKAEYDMYKNLIIESLEGKRNDVVV